MAYAINKYTLLQDLFDELNVLVIEAHNALRVLHQVVMFGHQLLQRRIELGPQNVVDHSEHGSI